MASPVSPRSEIAQFSLSRPGTRRGSPVGLSEPPPAPMYDGNPIRLRLAPVLGQGQEVPESLRDKAPAQLREPLKSEQEGAMMPIHAAYSRAELMNWYNLQARVAHRFHTQIEPPNMRAHDAPQEAPRPDDDSISEAPEVPGIGMQDTIGWAAVAAREGRTNVHPTDTEAKAALTVHMGPTPAWNEPWEFDESLGAGRAEPVVPIAGLSEEKTATLNKAQRRKHMVRMFLLRNVYVPLLCRVVNVMVMSTTLALGIRLRLKLDENHSEMAVGMSPLLAIVFSPLSIAHALFQIWIEYFSRPIGLWKLSSKLWYTALELIFICLWSAELALTLDNYFTSTIVCINASSPFYQNASAFRTELTHPESKGTLCQLQVALICVVFISVIVYLIVFMVRAPANPDLALAYLS